MMILELTQEQAETLCDFLEASFIGGGKGIGCDPDLFGNEYVENIRAVYNLVKAMVGDTDA